MESCLVCHRPGRNLTGILLDKMAKGIIHSEENNRNHSPLAESAVALTQGPRYGLATESAFIPGQNPWSSAKADKKFMDNIGSLINPLRLYILEASILNLYE